jgi:hypothetical protein
MSTVDKAQSTALTGLLIALTVMVVACVIACGNVFPYGDPVVIPVSTVGAYLDNGHPAALFKPGQGTTEDEVTVFDEGPKSASPTGTPLIERDRLTHRHRLIDRYAWAGLDSHGERQPRHRPRAPARHPARLAGHRRSSD